MSLSRALPLTLLCLVLASTQASAQSKPTPDLNSVATRATKLAAKGECETALPLLQKAAHVPDPELKRTVGLAGVRCSLSVGRADTALIFLELLGRNFPVDPEV